MPSCQRAGQENCWISRLLGRGFQQLMLLDLAAAGLFPFLLYCLQVLVPFQTTCIYHIICASQIDHEHEHMELS